MAHRWHISKRSVEDFSKQQARKLPGHSHSLSHTGMTVKLNTIPSIQFGMLPLLLSNDSSNPFSNNHCILCSLLLTQRIA